MSRQAIAFEIEDLSAFARTLGKQLQGADGAPAKGSWYFLTIDGETAQAIRAAAVKADAWGSVRIEVTIGGTTWRTSLFPSKQAGGWLLPLKAAVRKAEKLAEGTIAEAVLTLA